MERDQGSASTHLESVGTPSKAAVAVVRGQQSPQSCGVSRTVPSRGIRHSPPSNPVVSDVRLRSLHRLVTLARAPCGRVHRSQSGYVRVQRLRAQLRREEGRECGGTEERRDRRRGGLLYLRGGQLSADSGRLLITSLWRPNKERSVFGTSEAVLSCCSEASAAPAACMSSCLSAG